MIRSIILIVLCCWLGRQVTQAQSDNSTLILRIENTELAYPRMSADGNKILYQANHDGIWSLWILDMKTKKSIPVLQDRYNNNFPDWNSNQTKMAFVSDRDGNEEIYLMNIDGTNLQRITNDPSRDIHPYFSPDGKYLLYNTTRINGSFDIMRYDFGNKTTKVLSSTPENETCARYCPDMKSMVYLQNSETHDDIFVADSLNKNPVSITKSPFTRDGWPVFSFDSKWVYYSAMDSGTFCIYRAALDGSGKTKLTSAPAGTEDARVSLARNGHYMIFNRRYGTTIEIRGMEIS